jgi:hypothetical protein
MWRVVILTIVVTVLFAGTGEKTAAQTTGLEALPPSRIASLGNGPLTVEVWAKEVTTGLGSYVLEVDFDPAVLSYEVFADGGFLTSTGRSYDACPSPTPRHNPAGGIVSIACTTLGDNPLGPTGSGLLATVTFAPVAVGSTALETSQSVLTDVAGNPICHPVSAPCDIKHASVTVAYGSNDTDGDGCVDIQEASMGFDPLDPWDVFDPPVPARADPTPNGVRDGVVNFNDVLAVLFYTGTWSSGVCGDHFNAYGVDYDCDKGSDSDGDTVADIPPDGIPDGRDYDRSPGAEPNPPWDAAAPNGAITMQDVLVVLAQVGLDCNSSKDLLAVSFEEMMTETSGFNSEGFTGNIEEAMSQAAGLDQTASLEQTANPDSAAVAAATTYCRTGTAYRYATSRFIPGLQVWRFYHSIYYCYNGSRLTRTPISWSWASISNIAPGWDYQGEIGSRQFWLRYPNSYYSFRQGKFQYCILRIGVCQTITPWVSWQVYGSGTAYYRTGN